MKEKHGIHEKDWDPSSIEIFNQQKCKQINSKTKSTTKLKDQNNELTIGVTKTTNQDYNDIDVTKTTNKDYIASWDGLLPQLQIEQGSLISTKQTDGYKTIVRF